MRDKVFRKKLKKVVRFEFNENVAKVFDNMVERSIPFYHEIHRLIIDLAGKIKKKNVIIYDLGCSTGTTMILLDQFLKKKGINAHFIGIDNSIPMLEKCREKLIKNKVRSYTLLCADLTQFDFGKADMVIMNYTLQFIPVKNRLELLKKIYKSLNSKGLFVMTEKIHSEEKNTQDLITELYYDFKERNGYSRLEIAQKREALEKFLITLSTKDELELMKKAGFKKRDQIFRWYNFSCFLGMK